MIPILICPVVNKLLGKGRRRRLFWISHIRHSPLRQISSISWNLLTVTERHFPTNLTWLIEKLILGNCATGWALIHWCIDPILKPGSQWYLINAVLIIRDIQSRSVHHCAFFSIQAVTDSGLPTGEWLPTGECKNRPRQQIYVTNSDLSSCELTAYFFLVGKLRISEHFFSIQIIHSLSNLDDALTTNVKGRYLIPIGVTGYHSRSGIRPPLKTSNDVQSGLPTMIS